MLPTRFKTRSYPICIFSTAYSYSPQMIPVSIKLTLQSATVLGSQLMKITVSKI
jgi:hypothetical protein